MLLNKKAVRDFCHEREKRITTEGIEQLERKTRNLLLSSISLTPKSKKTVTGIEIGYSNSNYQEK